MGGGGSTERGTVRMIGVLGLGREDDGKGRRKNRDDWNLGA